MGAEELGQQLGHWRGKEGPLIRVFLVMFLALAALEMTLDVVYREVPGLSFWEVVLGIGRNMVVAYAITSFVLGFIFLRDFRREGIVPLRELLGTMCQVAVVVAVFLTVMFFLDLAGWAETGLYDAVGVEGPDMTAARTLATVVAFLGLTLGGTLLAEAVVLVGGFGIVGMIYTFEVGGTPRLIHRLEGITRSEDRASRAVMWFFGIPAALDTDVVLVDEPVEETTFPWRRFRTAVLWQVAFGIILAVYVSLNPWLLRTFSVDQLFRFMSTAFVVLPFLVLPWFVHRRLNARFRGVNRDFYFYKAFKDRLTGLIIAGGTLVIFLKFAWETSSVSEILVAFTSYVIIMTLCIIAFTFVYFNFFENRLARESYSRWLEAREALARGGSPPSGGDGGGAPPVSGKDVSSPPG